MVSCSSVARSAPETRASTTRSPASTWTRSRACPASAASSRAASMAASSRGASSTRPAQVREVSTTMTMRRGCSGCQVRTTVLAPCGGTPSMLRTSSPSTYSRRLSNSVPCPRVARGPAVQLPQHGEPAGQVLAGRERVERPQAPRDLERPLPGGQAQRAGGAHGHPVRGAVAAAGRGQRRRHPGALAGRDGEGMPRGGGPGRGRPGVADGTAQSAPSVLVTRTDVEVCSPRRTSAAPPGRRSASVASGQEDVEADEDEHRDPPPPHRVALRPHGPAPARGGPARRCGRSGSSAGTGTVRGRSRGRP